MLVGSEVDVVLMEDAASSNRSCSPENSHPPVGDEDDHRSSLSPMMTAYDSHPPVTPPSAAESLFLQGLPTQTISAAALAYQIHQRHKPLSVATSIATDDFVSATEDFDLHLSTDEENPFGKDALLHSREPLYEDDEFQDSNMNADELHVDAAEKVYDTAKGVWAWGKGIVIFSPFMGMAEGIAGKIVETAGSSLEEVDNVVVDKLHGLDDGILNPAIQAVVKTVLGAAGKTEEFVKPIILAVLKPVGLIKDEAEPTTSTKKPYPAPELTTTGTSAIRG